MSEQTIVRVRPTAVDARDEPSPPEAHPSPCPECGSSDVQKTPRLAIFALGVLSLTGFSWAVGIESLAVALLVISGALAAFLLDPWKCVECGNTWAAELTDGEMAGDSTDQSDGEPEVDYIGPNERD